MPYFSYEMMPGQKALERDMIVEYHVCDNCDAILEDIIETGATVACNLRSVKI